MKKILIYLIVFALGVLLGLLPMLPLAFRFMRVYDFRPPPEVTKKIDKVLRKISPRPKGRLTAKFNEPLPVVDGQSFGPEGFLTFELFRGGTFEIDGRGGWARQVSPSYRDSALIRSSGALPPTYKIRALVGEIDYGLEKLQELSPDPEYPEGPLNENGCYLLTIVDEAPTDAHTNIWWHQHRKVTIDVDNNVWGHGMPNPVFMVYFDRDSKLFSFSGASGEWLNIWDKAVAYDEKAWYWVEIEKTETQYILSISSQQGELLQQGRIARDEVWRGQDETPDFVVIGDPHENYYQGSLKIKEISLIY